MAKAACQTSVAIDPALAERARQDLGREKQPLPKVSANSEAQKTDHGAAIELPTSIEKLELDNENARRHDLV